MDASVAPTQVRDAFSLNADGHSQPVNDSLDNLNSTTRDVELENDNQFVEELDTANTPNSVLFVIHSRTKKLEGGFQPISPPDEGEPHVFTQHNVRDEDWAKFLSDLQDAARLLDSPPTRKSLLTSLFTLPFADGPLVAPPSSLPGLFSSLNLGEGDIPAVPSTLASSPIQPAMVMKLWNKHYFHPRGLDIVLAKGPRSLSGDTTMPPPDFSEPSATFDRGAFVPSFHPHGLPHPPAMHSPPFPFMGHMPPTHAMYGPPPFPSMHHGAFPGTSFPPMHEHDQQFLGPDFMYPRGGSRGRGGRGGRGGPGDRGRGFVHFSRGRGGFAGGLRGMAFGMNGPDVFGSRGRGSGPRGRGGFAHFGQHPHAGFFAGDDFDFAAFGNDGDMEDIIDLRDVGEDVTEPADDRKRSHSVCSDSSSSTMSSKERTEKQVTGNERVDKPDHERRRGSHHRHGHGHSHLRRGDLFAGHDRDAHGCRGHRKGHMDAKMAQKFACRRGHFRPGTRGVGFGDSLIPHHYFPGMFSDDGYYRLIVVDRQV